MRKPPRTSGLKATMTALVYGFAGLVFWGEYKAIGGLLWALAILRIFLFIREKQRYASMPGPNSSEILDAPERPE